VRVGVSQLARDDFLPIRGTTRHCIRPFP